jgi:hypothetical protein
MGGKLQSGAEDWIRVKRPKVTKNINQRARENWRVVLMKMLHLVENSLQYLYAKLKRCYSGRIGILVDCWTKYTQTEKRDMFNDSVIILSKLIRKFSLIIDLPS